MVRSSSMYSFMPGSLLAEHQCYKTVSKTANIKRQWEVMGECFCHTENTDMLSEIRIFA